MHFKAPFLDREFRIKTSRSGGKGGQNVNKLETKVLLEFNITDSLLLNDEEKSLLLEKLQSRLTKEGIVQVSASIARTQFANRQAAVKKMYALLNKCFIQKKKRTATRPTKGSVERRLNSKKQRSMIKKDRASKLSMGD